MKVIRNGYEININDNRLKWLEKAELCGKHNPNMYIISHSIEDYGVAWSFAMKPKFCYPAIIKKPA